MSNTVSATDAGLPSLSDITDAIGECQRLLRAALLAVEGAAFEEPKDSEAVAGLIDIIQNKLEATHDDAWRLHEAHREREA